MSIEIHTVLLDWPEFESVYESAPSTEELCSELPEPLVRSDITIPETFVTSHNAAFEASEHYDFLREHLSKDERDHYDELFAALFWEPQDDESEIDESIRFNPTDLPFKGENESGITLLSPTTLKRLSNSDASLDTFSSIIDEHFDSLYWDWFQENQNLVSYFGQWRDLAATASEAGAGLMIRIM